MVAEDSRLAGLPRVAAADVYKKDVLAAHLSRQADGGVEFAYLDGYDGAAVATTLPVGTPALATTGGGLPAFFAGTLPEGHRLNVLRRAVKTSADDELSLLLAVGEDLPGDVRVVPAGARPQEPAPAAAGDTAELDFAELMEEPDLRGLPGVQPKLSASMLSTPVRWGSEEAILKIDPADHPHLVVNEHAHLVAAKGLPITAADSSLVTDRQGRRGLVVRRFDRDGQGVVRRRAVEDAGQVMGLLPAAKYTPASEDVVLAMSGACAASLVAVRNLYLQFVFAWLTGNGDLHAKNVSILEQGNGTMAVSPMYDVPSTVVYRDFNMALTIDGRVSKLRARHWAAFADAIGLNPKAAVTANAAALRAARTVDWGALPFEGSVRLAVQRELAGRRRQLES